MAKRQVKKVPKRAEKEVKKYPLKKPMVIGSVLRPVGYEIPLSDKGYRFYKQKNII